MALATSNPFTIDIVSPPSGALSVGSFTNDVGTGYHPSFSQIYWQTSKATITGTLIEWSEGTHGSTVDNSIREYIPATQSMSVKFANTASSTYVAGYDNFAEFYVPAIDSFLVPSHNVQWSRAANAYIKGNVAPLTGSPAVIGRGTSDLIYNIFNPALMDFITGGSKMYNSHTAWSSTYNCGFWFGGGPGLNSGTQKRMFLIVPTAGLGLGVPNPYAMMAKEGSSVPDTVNGKAPYKSSGRDGCCFLGEYVYWVGGRSEADPPLVADGANTGHFFRMRITPHLTSQTVPLSGAAGTGAIENLPDCPMTGNYMLLMADPYTNALLVVGRGGIYAYDVTSGAWTGDITPAAYRSWPGDGMNTMPEGCVGDFIDTYTPSGTVYRAFFWRPGKADSVWLSDQAPGYDRYRTLTLVRGTYTTAFNLNETTISEGGIWRGSDPNQTRVRTNGGLAFGTQTVDGYDDSVAYLPGFGNNYEVEVTLVKNAGASGGTNKEAEIWLRCSDGNPTRSTPYGNTQTNGYEINIQQDGAYLQCGRFKDINIVDMVPTVSPATGVKFRARIEGQRIRCWLNNVLQFDRTDSAPGNYTTGNPGIGFYRHASDGSSLATHFCFTDFTVTRLP